MNESTTKENLQKYYDQLTGVWELHAVDINPWEVFPPGLAGGRPQGLLIYAGARRVSYQSMSSRRPAENWQGDPFGRNPAGEVIASPENIQEAFWTYSAYYGRYAISLDDPGKLTVTHFIEGASSPYFLSDSGKVQPRGLVFEKELLRLTTPPIGGRVYSTTFRRLLD